MAKISEMSDDEAGATLLKAYRGACDNYDPTEHGEHPSHAVNSWIRNARSGASDDGGLGPVENQNKAKVGEDDNDEGDPDVQAKKSVTGGGKPAGNAMDSAVPAGMKGLKGYGRIRRQG